MGNNNHTEIKKISTVIINRTINHFVPDYDGYTSKEKEMIQCAAKLYCEKFEAYTKMLQKAVFLKIDVSTFCKEYGISRMSMYKKDENGQQRYKNIISIINKMTLELETVKIKKMREILNEKDEDHKLLNSLLEQQIEYFKLKEENDSLRKKIRKLEKENKSSQSKKKYLN